MADLPRHLFRLKTSAGTRLVLAALYLDASSEEVVAFLAGNGAAPFVAPPMATLRIDSGYSRAQLHRALAELATLREIRAAARLMDGRLVRGWELTPSPSPSTPRLPLELSDGKGPPEAEALIDGLHAARLALGLRSQRRPTTADDLTRLERPIRLLGVGWEAWATVIRRAAEDVRRQAQREGDIRRAAAAPLFTLAGLAGPNFARYFERSDLDTTEPVQRTA